MKTKLFVIAGCFFAAVLQIKAQGTIIPNGITFFPGSATGIGSEIHIIHDPAPNTGYTGFNFTPQGSAPSSTFQFTMFADVGVRVFSVQDNDQFTLSSLPSFTELTSVNPWGTGANTATMPVGSTFYLGFYTGSNPWVGLGQYTGNYSNPLLGWGEFQNVNGVIQMIGSGLEYGGSGIIVGTDAVLAAVPEPSTFALFGLSLPLLWRFRKARA